MSSILTRLRVPLGFLFAGVYLYSARPVSQTALAVGVVFVVLGCVLRSWAAGYLFKGKRVAFGGPYAWIRNPLYTGSFLIGTGCCVAVWQLPLPLTTIIVYVAYFLGFGVVYRAKTLAEGVELERSLGDDYRRYAERVPPFLPTRGRVADLGHQNFSGELYRKNKEYECIIGCVAILVFLFWRMRSMY